MNMRLFSTLVSTLILSTASVIADSYTLTLPAGYSLIANQLDHVGGNSLKNLFSPGTLPDATTILKWNCSGYDYYLYDGAAGISPDGWYDQNYTPINAAAIFLNPGEGFWIQSPLPIISLTFTGDPHVPVQVPTPLPCGCGQTNFLSRQTVGVGTYENMTGLTPQNGAAFWRWNGVGYDVYTFANCLWSPSVPTVDVGQAALILVPCVTNNPCPCPPEPLVLFNTGVDANGVGLTNGAVDPHYVLTTNPNGGGSNVLVVTGNGLTNSSTSKWIGSGYSSNGTYIYRMTFTLPCTNNAIIIGQWAVDNSGTMQLNGNATPVATIATINSYSFTTWHPFALTAGLVAGQNTLTFSVTNIGAGPTGLRVELSGTADCCSTNYDTNCCANCTSNNYVSYTNTIYPGNNFLVNHLCQGTNNTLANVLPIVPDGTMLQTWDPITQSYNTIQYFDSTFGGWVDNITYNPSTTTLDPGEGFTIQNNSGATFTLVIRGCPPNCPPPCGPGNGYSLVGRLGIGTATWADLFSCPPPCGARLTVWDVTTQSFTDYNYDNLHGWVPPAPVLPIGQSVFVSVQPNTNCLPCTNNLVVNGGFEYPLVSTSSFFTNGAVPGWKGYVGSCGNSAAAIELWGLATSITPAEGSQDLEISSSVANEAVCQTLNTLTPGCPATLCFEFTGRPGIDSATQLPYDNHFTFALSGGAVMSVPLNPAAYNPPTNGWQQFCTNFVPTSSTLTISFSRQPTTGDVGGAHIDNVVLVQCCTNPCITMACAGDKTMPCNTNWSFDTPVNIVDNCCTNYSLTFSDVSNNSLCSLVITRTWLVSDVCGNSNTCSQTVTVTNVPLVFVSLPTGTNYGCNPASNLLPTDAGVLGLVAIAGSCSAVITNVTHLDTTTNCNTYRTFTITASNVCGSAVSANIQYSWMNNTNAPVITPSFTNLTVYTCSNSALVFFGASATSACCTNVTIIAWGYGGSTGGITLGHTFGLGTTTIEWLATDCCGNTATNYVTITVANPPAVVITCPPSIFTNICSTNVVVYYPNPTVTNGTLQSCAPASGSVFPLGTTIVTCTATNACGTNTCTFYVTVTGSLPPQSWTPEASMQTNRYAAAAELLPSGRVLVAGGITPGVSFSTVAEVFDPALSGWVNGIPALPQPHRLTSTRLSDGRVLVAGDDASPSYTAYLYDEVLNQWISAGVPNSLHVNTTLTRLNSGHVLMAGGYCGGACATYSTAEIFQLPSTWTTTVSMTTTRHGHTATLLPSGQVLVAGGAQRWPVVVRNSCELFTEGSPNTWSPAATMNQPRVAHTATLLPNGKVLVVGGITGASATDPYSFGPTTSTAEIYDPASNTWTPAASMSTPRNHHTATLLACGKLLIAGGQNDSGPLSSCEIYDYVNNSWSFTAPMSVARAVHTATLLPSGQVFVAGGLSLGGVYLASSEVYTPGCCCGSTNKTVACGSVWSFDAPSAANMCDGYSTNPVVFSTLTNGPCPQVITRTWVFTNACGYSNFCSQTVTVTNVPPVITPSFTNLTVYTCSNSALVFFGASATSACCTNVTIIAWGYGGSTGGITLGHTFGLGTTTIEWLATDCCGNTATNYVTITVANPPPPVITPSFTNLTVYTCSNSALVFFGASATSAYCTNVTIIAWGYGGSTGGITLGHTFGLGTTTIEWLATDCCGNTATNYVTVTVNNLNDTTPPVFTTYCTTNHYMIGGNNFTTPVAATPSANLLARLHAAGIQSFKNFDQCTVNSFLAHTFNNLPPCITGATLTIRLKPCGDTCYNDSIGLSFTGAGGILSGTSWGRYLGYGNPQAGLDADNWCNHTSGQVFTFDLSTLPQPNSLPAVNLISSLNANGFLDLTEQDDSGVDYAILDVVSCCCATNKTVAYGTPWSFDQPTAYDAVAGTNVTITYTTYTNSLCPLVVTRTWIATDPCGNSSTCSQTVIVGQSGPCQIFNTGMTGNLPVAAGLPDPNFVLLSSPGAGNNCFVVGTLPTSWVTNTTASQWVGPTINPGNSPAGVYHYQLVFILCCTNNAQLTGRMAVDDSAGLYLNGNAAGSVTGFASYTPLNLTSGFVPGLNVLDIYVTNGILATGLRAELTVCAGGLIVVCPTNKVVDCGSKWSFDVPTASSCCSNNLTIALISAGTNGICPKIATQTWLIADGCGNTNICTQTVTIRDTLAPVVFCPTNKIIVALDSNCMVHIPLVHPQASDNCTPASQLVYVQNPPVGSTLPGPCQVVTVTVSDACGNITPCQVMVCGQDKTPPTVLYPKSITVSNCVVPNVLPFVSASDNCTPSNLLHFTQSPVAGTTIAAGGNIVTVTVTDLAGNTTAITISLAAGGVNSFLNVMYNTAVNGSKVVLPNSSVDPHYTLGPVPGGTPAGAGNYNAPNAIVLTTLWGLPPFTASQWIDPGVNAWSYPSGFYTYTNQFTLPSGANPLTASISGRWAADDGGTMYLNGLATANKVSTIPASYGFNHWTYFTISSGILGYPTVNKLYFVVTNAAAYSPSPTGLRVEFTNAVVNCSTCTPPAIISMTANQSRPLNSTVVFNAGVSGTPPLTYQWYHNNVALVNNAQYSGINTPTLTITGIGYTNAGTYYVCIGNPCGGVCSVPKKLTISKGWPWWWAWWNFAQVGNPLAATVGPDLILIGTNGFGISSGSTADFGLPNIGGQVANVISVQPLPGDTFIQLPFIGPPTNTSVSSYTVLMDVLMPTNGIGTNTIFEIGSSGQDRVVECVTTSGSYGLTVSGTVGGVPVNPPPAVTPPSWMWNRVALVMNQPDNNAAGDATMTLYVNGSYVATVIPPPSGIPHVPVLPIDYLADVPATLLSSPEGTSGEIYAASIQFHAVAMTAEMIAGLGSPDSTPLSANDTSVGVQPVLSATTSNGVVQFSWTGSGYVLQEATDLSQRSSFFDVFLECTLPFTESQVGNDIVTTVIVNPVTEGPAKFYRLIYAP